MPGKPNDKWMQTMLRKHGSREAVAEFMAGVGRMGGQKPTTGGFALDITCECDLVKGEHVIRQCAGVKGGRISRRPKRIVSEE